ncbi:L-asparaginase [Sporomusaceae bacterium BoRhaA]|uniref:asparaginase n=1 Tax=Pelorhabdus rhamnosifermentans TaxID=2772457 RepID=UPI001FE78E64|nr:asparaginase [Pelorhabdus rhamnosifermentans]MBU2699454.1 L-asparaginase [Pelorhabdus rhamnosifermentans]
MKKVIVITTGGTIAMKYDAATDGLIPAVNGADLVEAVPALKEVAQVEVVEFSNVPSGYITPKSMFELSKTVDQYAQKKAIAGIVITHGTDTLEETAYLLDLTVHTQKPVCITGAMRGASQTSPDGPGNILAAVKTAACDEAYNQGVLVVLNDEIHAALEVTKTHSTNTNTFESPAWGPVGRVYPDKVVIKRHSLYLQKIQPATLVDDVHLLKVVAGMDDFFFRCLVKKKAKGIVVEAFGCGNVPLAVKNGIEMARKNDIPVVLATRVHAGRVVNAYSYSGSASSMKEANIILAGEITGQKARIKLMLSLGMTGDVAKIKEYFDA